MAEYIISRVSSTEPKEWSFDDKRTGQKVYMETYKVMFNDEPDPILVHRKQGDKPKLNEILLGTIEETDFGKKFKKEPKQNGFRPKDTNEIKAEWAIGQAIEYFKTCEFATHKAENEELPRIEELANSFYKMVERVKANTVADSGYDKAKAAAQKIKEKQSFSDGSPVDNVFPVNDRDEINLDDIPF